MKEIVLLFLLTLSTLTAQVLRPGIEDALLTDPVTSPAISTQEAVLPDSFDTIQLSSSLEDVQLALTDNKYFFYRGPADVSFRPFSTESVIDVVGLSFISRASFQFDEDKTLVSILLHLDTKTLDYYTMYNTFRNTYNEPVSVNPSRMVWDDGYTKLVLEKPLTVKYLRSDWFSTETDLEQTEYEKKRNTFLDNF